MHLSHLNRRAFTLGLGVLAALAGPTAFAGKDDDAKAAVLPSGDIVEKLSKDIVLDAPGATTARNIEVRRNPLSLKVHFAFGSSKLLTQGQRQLDQLAAALNHKSLAGHGFELAGHTDAVGSHATNMRLSLERANAVKAYLIQTHGLATERLLTIGFGFTRLALPSDPQSGANRRVEVRPLKPVEAGRRNEGAEVSPSARASSAGTLVPTPKSGAQ